MSVRKLVCLAAVLAFAWSPLAGVRAACAVTTALTEPAGVGSGGPALTAPTNYSKPPVLAHPDRAPSVPGAASPAPTIAGPVPPAPVVPKVDGSGGGSAHAVEVMSSLSGALLGGSSGANLISFAKFDNGDIVVVQDRRSFTGHAGLFDRRFYVDIRSYAVLSANTAPANGVQREQCLKYRANDEAWGLWVPKEANHGVAVRDWAYKQMGKPYNILAAKTDLRSFYCSKLVWAAWRYTAGVDLDADGGYWVWPVDLVNSPSTRIFGYWT
jgi:hypothetical protein